MQPASDRSTFSEPAFTSRACAQPATRTIPLGSSGWPAQVKGQASVGIVPRGFCRRFVLTIADRDGLSRRVARTVDPAQVPRFDRNLRDFAVVADSQFDGQPAARRLGAQNTKLLSRDGNKRATLSESRMRETCLSGSMSGRWKRSMIGLVRHRQTKGPATDRPHLNHRATSRLYPLGPIGCLR
jgi:hypothetical protein